MSIANAIIVIPTYREMNDFEKVSLQQALMVLSNYNFCLIVPDSLDTSSYMKYHEFQVERFPDNFFTSKNTYSELMLLPELYHRFEEFEYMLVLQLDAFVFTDRLKEFCEKGYDYIGAPVPRYAPVWKDIEASVGNGGLSLRKISSVLRVLDQKDEIYKKHPVQWDTNLFKLWEDVFFAYCSTIPELNFNVPSAKVALEFAVENDMRHVYRQMPEKLSFGCHAWWEVNYWHWKPIIERFGYSLPEPSSKQSINLRLQRLERYALKRLLRRDNYSTCRFIANKVFAKNSYIIWGYGEYGRMVLKMLDCCGKEVSAVIDNFVTDTKTYTAIPILKADIDVIKKIKCPIIIATLKYEDEIIKNEVSNTIKKQNIVRISMVLNMILKEYSRFMINRLMDA